MIQTYNTPRNVLHVYGPPPATGTKMTPRLFISSIPYYVLFKQRHQFLPYAVPDEGLGGGVRVNAIRLHQILLGADSVYQRR